MNETTASSENKRFLPGKGFLLGMAAAVTLGLLLGAAGSDRLSQPVTVINDPEQVPVALLRNGRYQIAAVNLHEGGSAGYGIFIVDTSTGVTKPVYATLVGKKGRRRHVNNLGKPFAQIK